MPGAAGRGFRSQALQHTNLRLGEGLAGRAALDRTVIEIHNLDATLSGPLRVTLLEQEHFVDYHAVPLIAKGQVKGVLEVFHRQARGHDPEWLEFLEALGGQAAIAINNAQLYQEIDRSKKELETTNRSLETSLKKLDSLYAGLSPISTTLSTQELMSGIINRIIEATGADAALIRIRDHKDGSLPTPWAAKCWKVFLDTEADIARAIRYVEDNPVKEGKRPQRWPFVVPFEG